MSGVFIREFEHLHPRIAIRYCKLMIGQQQIVTSNQHNYNNGTFICKHLTNDPDRRSGYNDFPDDFRHSNIHDNVI